jgi:hypothetical protein
MPKELATNTKINPAEKPRFSIYARKVMVYCSVASALFWLGFLLVYGVVPR